VIAYGRSNAVAQLVVGDDRVREIHGAAAVIDADALVVDDR
jgi:hypothetical protein